MIQETILNTAYICFARSSWKDTELAASIALSIRNCYPEHSHFLGKKVTEHISDRDYDEMARSIYLIVICSKDSANDDEVNRQVEVFLHNQEHRKHYYNGVIVGENVVAIMTDGTPWALYQGEKECLPVALRNPFLKDRILFLNWTGFWERDYAEIDRAKYRIMDLERELADCRHMLATVHSERDQIAYLNKEKERIIDDLRSLHESGGYTSAAEVRNQLRYIEEEKERIRREDEEIRRLRRELEEEREKINQPDCGITFAPHCSSLSQFSPLERLNKKGAKKVFSSVFAPAEVRRNSHMLVQLYLHLAKETERVIELAAESQSSAQRRDYAPLQCKLLTGDRISVSLTVSCKSVLKEEKKEMIWMGSFTKCTFDFLVPPNLPANQIHCSLLLSIGGYPVGEMSFVSEVVPAPRRLNSQVLSKRFKSVFISYSHKDSNNVQFVAKAYKALGIKYFFDSDQLEGGDVFEEKIMSNIDSSDLFILCWSENAAMSEFIPKEIDRALMHAYPQRPHEEATLKVFPISIEPHAQLPLVMADKYHFEVIG